MENGDSLFLLWILVSAAHVIALTIVASTVEALAVLTETRHRAKTYINVLNKTNQRYCVTALTVLYDYVFVTVRSHGNRFFIIAHRITGGKSNKVIMV